jgi:SAM-dependent methyltransferase
MGNPFPWRFDTLVQAALPEATILDIGGGDRRHLDNRVMNFEYASYPNVNILGDAAALPFPDNSVDLILNQAVLEHVKDPKQVVNEFYRVLKPGAQVYAEFAFMQPLHAAPFHYFNITPHGAAFLFEDFTITETGTMGGLAFTMNWIFDIVNAQRKLGTSTTKRILSDLEKLDATLTADDLNQITPALFVQATKPITSS